MKWNLPNILTVIRLAAAPGVAVMFLYFTRPYADWFALILFVTAAVTDWFDGYLARAWGQETKLGAMLDPIADKAMVVIALMVIIGFSSWSPWLVLPATVILFREVLKVTKLAKWKTALQMTAIAVLFGQGVFEHYLGMSIYGMDEAQVSAVLRGDEEDLLGLGWKVRAMEWSGLIGHWLLWGAAALTAVTGFDYLLKAMPHLREGR